MSTNGEVITKEVAKSMIDRDQNNNPGAIKAELCDTDLIKSMADRKCQWYKNI